MLLPTHTKIFILEADKQFASAIIQYLNSYTGFEFIEFTSVEKFMNSFHQTPDIIIMSDDLEGLDRSEVVLLIKNKLPAVEVIVTSAAKDIYSVIEYLRYGAYDFIIRNSKCLSMIEMAINSILYRRNIREHSEFPI